MHGKWIAKSSSRRYYLVYDRTGDNETKVEIARKNDAFLVAEMFNRYEKNYDSLLDMYDKAMEELKKLRAEIESRI